MLSDEVKFYVHFIWQFTVYGTSRTLRLDEQVSEFVNREFIQRSSIRNGLKDLILVSLVVVMGDVPLEFVDQQWGAFGPTPLVANRVLDFNFVKNSSIVKLNEEGVADGSLGGVVILDAETLLLDAVNLGTEFINSWVRSRGISVAFRGQFAEDQGIGNHVVNSMVAIGEVVQWALLVNDTDGGFLGANSDTLDISSRLAHFFELVVENVGSLNGGLGMELSREGDLEEDVFHDIRAVGDLEFEWFALEKNIIEAPSFGSENRRKALFALLDHQGKVNGARASITRSPGLSWTCVRGMTVGAQRLTINPSLGYSINSLVAVQAEKFGYYGSRSNLDKNDMVKADSVERVEEGKAALDFMGLDHCLKDVTDRQRLPLPCQMIGNSQNGTKVIRWMTPFSGQETIIEVKPSNSSSDVESSSDGIKLKVGPRHASSIWYDGSFNNGTKKVGALGEPQGFKSTANGVNEA